MDKIQIESLLEKVNSYNSNADFALIKKAFDFADNAHKDQVRRSGDPYVTHCLKTANILADWKLDTPSIVAGLLHDCIEDGNVTRARVEKEFGETITTLVDGVTKVGDIRLRGSQEESFVENLRKMLLVMAEDLRVILIKLADRYHNMETLEHLPLEKQKRIAKETLEIYAPLAERLGMGEIKGKLEDLAFPFVYKNEHEWLKEYSAPFFKNTSETITQVKKRLLEELSEEKIPAEIHGRAKHLYSLFKKLLRPDIDRDITRVTDLVALRIIVNTVEQCYGSLGVVHKIYKPVPSLGISDYIAIPKPNGYRSIHTKVFGPEGQIIEIQIRTWEMHDQAENGIAAHWHYALEKGKEGVSDEVIDKKSFAPTEKMHWIEQLSAWQRQITDSHEFLDSVKFDALAHRIFIFTPKGDVKDLPLGATPVDFAYAVHTELGDRTLGAKVNGRIVPLDHKLKSGDICEVMLSKKPRPPNRKWLEFVVTTSAKREIGRGLKAEEGKL